jgi:RAB protein geranylgeranyltransferase component A
LSCAFSRIKKKVLVLDKNEYYGGKHSTFSLEEMNKIPFQIIHQMESNPDLMKSSRRFNIDLTCKPLFSNGPLIQQMIKSGIGRNMEFKIINFQFLFLDSQFIRIPTTKGDIFKNKYLKLTEKTYLMKFISQNRDEIQNRGKESFIQYLEENKLNERLQKIILYSIALLPSKKDITLEEGMKRLELFISSIGRFGSSSPFLYPLYGMSELPQLFCRSSSVYGISIIYNLRGYFCVEKRSEGIKKE